MKNSAGLKRNQQEYPTPVPSRLARMCLRRKITSWKNWPQASNQWNHPPAAWRVGKEGSFGIPDANHPQLGKPLRHFPRRKTYPLASSKEQAWTWNTPRLRRMDWETPGVLQLGLRETNQIQTNPVGDPCMGLSRDVFQA